MNKGINIKCYFAGEFMSAVDSEKYPEPIEAKKKFFEYINKHDLNEVIYYCKTISGSKKIDIINDSHFFILPTNYIYEMQPVSILEAMAYGLVVISTKRGIIPLMIDDGENGRLVPYGCPASIANVVEELINDISTFELFSKKFLTLT